MLKIYCTECGSPTTYTSAKPKFCSSCGKPFDKLVVNKVLDQKSTITKVKPNISKDIEDDYDNYDDNEASIDHVPNVSKIDYEIVDSNKLTEKIGNIAGTSSGLPRKKENREKVKRLTKADIKKFREEFAKEAGTLRPKTRGRKNG
jgi:uncharacterized Zn finger protein (UPF0148 family)